MVVYLFFIFFVVSAKFQDNSELFLFG